MRSEPLDGASCTRLSTTRFQVRCSSAGSVMAGRAGADAGSVADDGLWGLPPAARRSALRAPLAARLALGEVPRGLSVTGAAAGAAGRGMGAACGAATDWTGAAGAGVIGAVAGAIAGVPWLTWGVGAGWEGAAGAGATVGRPLALRVLSSCSR